MSAREKGADAAPAAAPASPAPAAPANTAPANTVPANTVPANNAPATTRMRVAPKKQHTDLFASEGGGIVIPVTPEYLRSGAFEKMLVERKIKWERAAPVATPGLGNYYRDAESKDKALRGKLPAQAGAAAGNQARYLLEADRDQVEKLLAELAGPSNELSLLKKMPEAARRKAVESVDGRVTIILVVPGAEPAAPAASKP